MLAASGIDFDATLVFALWAGEEQGLFGSRAHAQRLQENGAIVEATFNNDIVGNSRGGDGVVDAFYRSSVYAQGPEDSMSRSLARYVQKAAAEYVPSHTVRPMAREDRFSRSSDHTSFTQRGSRPWCSASRRKTSRGSTARTTRRKVLTSRTGSERSRQHRRGRAHGDGASCAARRQREGQPLIGRQPSGYDAICGGRVARRLRLPHLPARTVGPGMGIVRRNAGITPVRRARRIDRRLGFQSCGGGTRRAGEFD